MTIPYPAGGARVEVDGNGVSSTVAVPFAFWLGSDLRVIHTDASGVDTVWAYGPDFTISGGGGGAGGIAFTPADLVSGEKLTVLLADQGDQAISFSAGQIQPSTIETALDKLASRLQGVKEQVGRFVGLKESSRTSPPTLPNAGAGEYLGWNGAGTDLENKPPLTVGTVAEIDGDLDPTVILNEDGTMDFEFPKGSTGDVGPAGASGTVGATWTEVVAEVDISGAHSKDVTGFGSYEELMIVLKVDTAEGNLRPRLTLSDDDGSTFETSGYHYGKVDDGTYIPISPINDYDAADTLLVVINLTRLGKTMVATCIGGDFGDSVSTSNSAVFNNSNDVDALRVALFNSSNVSKNFATNSTIEVYGR